MSGSLPRWAHDQIHALVDHQGRPIRVKLTAGQESDIASATAMLADLPKGAMLLADKGYDANALRPSRQASSKSAPPRRPVEIGPCSAGTSPSLYRPAGG